MKRAKPKHQVYQPTSEVPNDTKRFSVQVISAARLFSDILSVRYPKPQTQPHGQMECSIQLRGINMSFYLSECCLDPLGFTRNDPSKRHFRKFFAHNGDVIDRRVTISRPPR